MIHELNNLIPYDGQVYLLNNFIPNKKSVHYNEKLLKNINWQARKIKLFGKQVLQPRLMCWMGDEGVSYKYSGTIFKPDPWASEVIEIKQILEKKLHCKFNSVLLNLYRDQNDSMGTHSDNEKELGDNPLIASVSLGEKRRFVFRHKKDKTKVQVDLESGSLLIMQGETQNFWKHELPKSKSEIGSRINLTFRKIIKPKKI